MDVLGKSIFVSVTKMASMYLAWHYVKHRQINEVKLSKEAINNEKVQQVEEHKQVTFSLS